MVRQIIHPPTVFIGGNDISAVSNVGKIAVRQFRAKMKFDNRPNVPQRMQLQTID
jgi:hypothetical protein